ncbi:teichoic acid D-Ala incorporation-associated protein DltX [Lactobacillus panisapium]|uniref:teichoic acid D-Ala incorporation-associated protein DltX n=1 Tax=Lactobacillus panisapium TaxID=2012495 RepID=UPI001C6958E5|nr:teichoic acid D-Ala incorporation-associated protein DltX [Lactobacillus panisapium]QYN59650.1 teichoic acid D-Ala incorporation-associated protein DltX [Lactobacillus panisapium]
MVKKDQTASRAKRVGKFMLTTIIYGAILIALIYLYQYSGLTSVHFIYNEF